MNAAEHLCRILQYGYLDMMRIGNMNFVTRDLSASAAIRRFHYNVLLASLFGRNGQIIP